MNESAIAYMKYSLAPKTEKSYERAFSEWESYAVDEAIPILPITPIDLGNFIANMADRTGSISKINLAIAAVADRHLGEHLQTPTTDASFRKMMAGVRRKLFKPAKSRAPLDKEILQDAYDLIATGDGGRLQDWRTLARLNLEFYGMLRWAEVSELKMEDIRFDMTGLVLHIRRSKTDQLGAGQYVKIQATEMESCPVEITRRYIEKLRYGTENGYFQPQIRSYKDGEQAGVWHKKLGNSSALEDTKAMMAIIGRDPTEFGEHSGRRGGATAASEAGVSWVDLKRHGRWASDSAPQRYIEQTDKKASIVANALAIPPREQVEESVSRRPAPDNAAEAARIRTVHGFSSQPPQKRVKCAAEQGTAPPTQIWNESQLWAMDQRKAYAQAEAAGSTSTDALNHTRGKGKAVRKLVFSQPSFQSARHGRYNNNEFCAPRRKPERRTTEQEEIEPEVIQQLFDEEF